MFLAKAESLGGKQKHQPGSQSHEAGKGACETDGSGSGLCLTKLFLPSDCAPVKLEVPNPPLRCHAKNWMEVNYKGKIVFLYDETSEE